MEPDGLAEKLTQRSRDRRAALRIHVILVLVFLSSGCAIVAWLTADNANVGVQHLFAMALLVAYWVFVIEYTHRRLRPRIKRPVVVCPVCGSVMKGRRVDNLLKENGCDGCGIALTRESVQ
jgi:hypothetical protein